MSNKLLQASEITCLEDLQQQIPPQPNSKINSKPALTLQSSQSAQEMLLQSQICSFHKGQILVRAEMSTGMIHHSLH